MSEDDLSDLENGLFEANFDALVEGRAALKNSLLDVLKMCVTDEMLWTKGNVFDLLYYARGVGKRGIFLVKFSRDCSAYLLDDPVIPSKEEYDTSEFYNSGDYGSIISISEEELKEHGILTLWRFKKRYDSKAISLLNY